MKKKLILGDEYDDALRHTLMAELAAMGATIEGHQWGLGGSQIIQTTKLRLGKDTLVVESETYVGLSIAGPARIVDRVASMLPAAAPKP
ncbi:MAG TPA: hypothetical protein VEQ59_15820 [Polyangiaceae bacterium]|nr:hypothetical protein [Polyangiaceae bacterium]